MTKSLLRSLRSAFFLWAKCVAVLTLKMNIYMAVRRQMGAFQMEPSTPLLLKHRNYLHGAGKHGVYREHKHYAVLIVITISMIFTLKQNLKQFDGPFWCLSPRSSLTKANSCTYLLCTSGDNFHYCSERKGIKQSVCFSNSAHPANERG